MTRASALCALRIATLVGLSASAALAIDYRSAGSAFCGPASGCAAVRETGLAYLWGAGITLPELGLVGLALTFALSLLRDTTWALRLSVLGGAVGFALLTVQAFALQTFCWLCVTTDVSSLAAAAFAGVALTKPRAADERAPLSLGAWAGLGLLASMAPAAWPSFKPAPPVPAALRTFYEPGKINVIEFADFECPFCRRLHGQLKELFVPYRDRLHVVRLNVPLDRHLDARHAAISAICAEPSGKAEELVEFLFTTEDLSKSAILEHTKKLGIATPEYQSCLTSRGPVERLARERAVLKEIGFEGLPTTYIGETRIVGAQPPEVFRDALELAASGSGERGVPGWLYALLVAGVALALVRLGWTKGSDAPANPGRAPAA